MDGTSPLADIEAIKRLKARYCRLLDTKRWDLWEQLLTADFVSDTSRSGGQIIVGAEEFVAFVRKSLGTQPTVHQVHSPEIDIISSDTAHGTWALNDVVRLGPGLNLNGYGHYHETYQKVDGEWLISTSTLTRLREDLFNGLFSVRIPPRLRDAAARVGGRLSK